MSRCTTWSRCERSSNGFGAVHAGSEEAVMGGDDDARDAARRGLREALGDAGMVDACAVIANYNALDRVADATGIPLEAQKEATTVELRADLGIDAFAAK